MGVVRTDHIQSGATDVRLGAAQFKPERRIAYQPSIPGKLAESSEKNQSHSTIEQATRVVMQCRYLIRRGPYWLLCKWRDIASKTPQCIEAIGSWLENGQLRSRTIESRYCRYKPQRRIRPSCKLLLMHRYGQFLILMQVPQMVV